MSWVTSPVQFEQEIREEHRAVTAMVALEIDRRLVQRTPVDTGRARSNWQPSVGVPASGTLPPMDPLTIQIAAAEKFRTEGLPFFPILYITNNLDYIFRLNAGSSKQAPANFVEMTVAEVASVL